MCSTDKCLVNQVKDCFSTGMVAMNRNFAKARNFAKRNSASKWNLTVCWIRTKDFQCKLPCQIAAERKKWKRRSQIAAAASDGNDGPGGPRAPRTQTHS